MVPKFRKYNAIAIIYMVLFAGTAIVVGTLGIINVSRLITRSYKVVPEKLARIELTTEGGNGFYYSDGRSGKDPQIIYRVNGSTYFRIRRERYESIVDRNALIDLTKNAGQRFLIFTDKKGFDQYNSGKAVETIEVYQVIVRNRAFVNMFKANELARKSITWKSVMCLIMAAVGAYYFFVYRKRTLKRQPSARIINI